MVDAASVSQDMFLCSAVNNEDDKNMFKFYEDKLVRNFFGDVFVSFPIFTD